MEWFACGDKMPDDGRNVIIRTDTVISMDREFIDIGYCFGKSWRDAEGCQFPTEIGKVVKWTEIPENNSVVWKQNSDIVIEEDVLIRVENSDDNSITYYVAHKIGPHVWQSAQGCVIDIHGKSVCYCFLSD